MMAAIMKMPMRTTGTTFLISMEVFVLKIQVLLVITDTKFY
jgi:hypothetical protein